MPPSCDINRAHERYMADPVAMEMEFYKAVFRFMLRELRGLFKTEDMYESADDLAQDITIKAWQTLSKVKIDNLGGFLRHLAQNARADYFEALDDHRERHTPVSVMVEGEDGESEEVDNPALNAGEVHSTHGLPPQIQLPLLVLEGLASSADGIWSRLQPLLPLLGIETPEGITAQAALMQLAKLTGFDNGHGQVWALLVEQDENGSPRYTRKDVARILERSDEFVTRRIRDIQTIMETNGYKSRSIQRIASEVPESFFERSALARFVEAHENGRYNSAVAEFQDLHEEKAERRIVEACRKGSLRRDLHVASGLDAGAFKVLHECMIDDARKANATQQSK